MRLALVLLALVALALPPSPRAVEPLSAAQFTQDFALRVRRAAPGVTVTTVHDLEVRLTGKDGRESTAFLDNAYAEYRGAPESLDRVLTRSVEVAVDARVAATAPPQRSRIVPIVKDRGWLDETRRVLRARGARDPSRIAQVWDEYGPELVVVYAEDQEKSIRYLTTDDLRALELGRGELRALAVKNLVALLPKIELQGRDGVFMMSAGGVYEASLVLVDTIWDGGQVKVDGDVVVAIPARDLLLVCGSRDAAAIAKVRQIAATISSDSAYPLTQTLFVRRDGAFRRL